VVKPRVCSRKFRVRLLETKIFRFHHNCAVLADNSTTSLVCVLRHFSLCITTGCYGSPRLSVRHHGRMSSCRAGSPYGILLVRNRKCPSMVGYVGYSCTPGLNLDTSMPHAHPIHKDSRFWWHLVILISGSRTRDFREQTLCSNHSATGARCQMWSQLWWNLEI